MGLRCITKLKNFMIQKQKNTFRLSFRFLAAVLVAGFCLIAFSCSDDKKSDPTPTKNIVALAQGTPSLSTLAALLAKYPDLVTLLSGSTKYTVFAPTNDAFTAFLAAIGQTSADNIPADVLKKALQYHVVAGEVKSTALTTSNVATAVGENIAVNVSSGVVLNTNTKVTTADQLASNGVVHIIDKVLIQPTVLPIVGTVAAPAYFNKGFSILTAAVVQGKLLTALLDGTKQYTVFAPTNDAFIAYLKVANEAAAITAVNGLDPAAVADILTFHVLGSEVKAAAIQTGTSPVTTIRSTNNKAFATKIGSTVTINNARVTTADVDASNGVVHVIDAVLTPPVGDIVAVATSTANASTFNILVASLTKASLVSTVQGTGPLTVFAPTDDAFLTLLRSAAFFNDANFTEDQVLTYISTMTNASTPLALNTLTEVLTYHVVPGAAYSINLTNNQVLTTAKSAAPNTLTVGVGATVTIDGSGSSPSTVNPANISATNGVVHVINSVLLP
jgi:transforming growth factor-beta-induced protein